MNARLLTALPFLVLAAPLAGAQVPDPPSLEVHSYALMDYASGQLLAQHDADRQVEPASLTKLMTVYVAFDEIRKGRIKRDDEVLVSEKAWRQGYDSSESRMFIEVGKRVKVEDLLNGVIVQSGNDASIALAEYIGGSEEVFTELMNQHAKALGLTHTHYTNATGVPDPALYTTAHDIARLSQALIRDFPQDYALFSKKEFVYNKIRQHNRNLLLWRDADIDGIKTGHTEAAGFCLASSAIRDGRRLIAVVMGSKSANGRAAASLALLNYGFRFFDTYELAKANAALTSVRVWKGEEKDLSLGLAQPLLVSLPRGARDQVQLQPEIAQQPFAPIKAGQVLGQLTVSLNGKILRSEPLIALRDLPEGSLWRRVTDEIRLRLGRPG